jgi:hypothetical protein
VAAHEKGTLHHIIGGAAPIHLRCFAILKIIKISDLVCFIPGLGANTAHRALRMLEIYEVADRQEYERRVKTPLLSTCCEHCCCSLKEIFFDLSKKEKERNHWPAGKRKSPDRVKIQQSPRSKGKEKAACSELQASKSL